MEVVNIYAMYGGEQKLAYTGRLYLAAERCNMTESGLRAALKGKEKVTVKQPESSWPRAEQYYATLG